MVRNANIIRSRYEEYINIYIGSIILISIDTFYSSACYLHYYLIYNEAYFWLILDHILISYIAPISNAFPGMQFCIGSQDHHP